MQAVAGDRLHIHSNVVGYPERTAEIVEVRGAGGEPPYLVRFDGGDISLVFPGPDTIVEHPSKASRGRRPARRG
jgi:Domain of unknown function (DUF1918)